MPAKSPNAKTHEAYLAALDDDQRTTLERIRKAIQSAAPKAEPCFSYGLPAFRLQGKPLAAFAAAAKHCAYYPMSGAIIAILRTELKNYDTSKGTIRFPNDQPLPAGLVRKLVKARIAEIAAAAK